MAEIKIEKKKPVWPWVLLIVLILAAIAYFVYANNEDNDYPDDMDDTQVDTRDDGTLNDSTTYEEAIDYSDSIDVMMLYSQSIKDSTRIGTDSTYTKSAFHNLTKVVIAKAEQYNLESSKPLEDLKTYSAQMDGINNSNVANMAGLNKTLKTMTTNIVSVLEAIQSKNFPTLKNNVADLKQTASEITTVSMEKQQTALQAFFKKANEVLNNMNS